MSDDANQLIAALAERDRLRSYVSNLDRLVAEGEVAGEQEALARADYERRISDSDSTIESLRASVRRDLTAAQSGLEARRSEAGRLRARHKVGELTLSQYQGEENRLSPQIRALEQNREYLSTLLQAETAEGLDTQQPHAAPATRQPKKLPPTEPAARERTAADGGIADSIIPRSPLRVAALVIAILLLASIRLPWLGASDVLGANLPTEVGVNVSFLVGLGGLLCGLGGVAAAFLRRNRARGAIHLTLGVLAIAALAGAMLLRELPLHDSYFRQLVTLQGGFYLYVAAAIALAAAGIAERRHAV